MAIYEEVLNQLRNINVWNYGDRSAKSAEPAALCSLALTGDGHFDEAEESLNWLAEIQTKSGGVTVDGDSSSPNWPTGLAILAWHHWDRVSGSTRFATNIERAISWLLKTEGTTIPPDEAKHIGHDTTLVGWPWVVGTHSWIEPTAISALALRTMDLADHIRVTDAIELLIDRQLPQGGCNYGNTFILGQRLRPHIQPTGWAMLALRGVASTEKIKKSLTFLRRSLSSRLSLVSASFAILGLNAHYELNEQQNNASQRQLLETLSRQAVESSNAYQLSLFAHAYQGSKSLLLFGS